eukprot:TRINITY_DN18336_c0_g1_i1.p1 TRINITY_DN18336_c0_g1~~TRINITY_DN18336_c0_g1_i1.p1  ORF type:complete len:547 (+),score=211.88 TRINITY_DN18336_c0_g1_i1:89-1642(+)
MANIVGISIGSDSMCLAVSSDDHPAVIVNRAGHRTTPTCIAFSESECIVGETAKQLAVKRPREVVQGVPLLLAYADEPGKLRPRRLAAELVENEDGVLTGVRTFAGNGPDAPSSEHSLQELCAALLKHMKQEAESFLGDKVEQCVLALPEGVASRPEAVRTLVAAAASVGLRVDRVTRSAAAALLGGDDFDDGEHLVVDCGGHSCTATAIEVRAGLLSVRKAQTALVGGIDVDRAVAKYFADEFRKKTKLDITDDPKAMRRLAAASEDTKKTLTQRPQGRLECEALAEGMDFTSQLSRSRFEALLAPVLRQIKELATDVAEASGVKQWSSVMLVGGTAHIAKLNSALEDAVGCEVTKPHGPEEVTAIGAAMQGASCARGVGLPTEAVWREAAKGRAGEPADPSGVQCRVARAAASIGVRMADGIRVLVKSGALLPCEASCTFATGSARAALVEIVQGESEDSASTLCRLALRDISQDSKELSVTVAAAADGALRVTAGDGVDTNVVAEVEAPEAAAP